MFLFDAEKVHYFAMNGLKIICKIPFAKAILAKAFTPKNSTATNLFGLTFRNQIGLGAGFDKNAAYLNELEALGFGFVEIGTVTPLPQAGNPKPRLLRLQADQALINRMGFNNDGMVAIAERLRKWKEKSQMSQMSQGSKSSQQSQEGKKKDLLNVNHELSNIHYPLIIGGNIGKNKDTPNELAWQDYTKCFTTLHPYVHYFVVNVSSPNTPGLRELQGKDSLLKIFTELEKINTTLPNRKPILLKIAPDLTWPQVDDVIALALQIKMDGLVVSNTTLERSNLSQPSQQLAKAFGAGGLSGKPITNKATELIQYITTKCNGTIPIIGSGGIYTKQDAATKLAAGATLLQVWTGFVYVGPSIVKRMVD